MRQDQQHAAVTPLELFFDLVFVFALTQVTAFMADELSWHGILRGVLVMMLLWWAWTGYAWLASVASAEERPIKLVLLTGMAAMFVLALCIPEAFDDLPGGLTGPVVLAICYLIFRVGFGSDDIEKRGEVLRRRSNWAGMRDGTRRMRRSGHSAKRRLDAEHAIE